MIAFLPLCSHIKPEQVLIIGGGDGGVAREVLKFPSVKGVTQVEIDARVVELSKKYLPKMSKSFESPKLNLQICDGFEYLKQHTDEFDVIITDSSDPIGPAAHLFTENYFRLLKSSLRNDGVLISQVGNIWQDLELIKNTSNACRRYFKNVKIAQTNTPTYPTGQICFLIACDDSEKDFSRPAIHLDAASVELTFYNADMHRGAFALPNFAQEALK